MKGNQVDILKALLRLKKPTFNVILILLFFAPAVASFYFGIQPHVVSSGSMRPNINPGDVVLSRISKVQEISSGEVILLFDNKTKTVEAHRVVNIVHRKEESEITTKGDSNPIEDQVMIEPSNLPLQKVVFVLPKAGYLLQATHTPQAKYLGGGLILTVISVRGIQKLRNSTHKESMDKL